MSEESLRLKWGTWKGHDLKTDKSKAAFRAYLNVGSQSAGSMTQHDSEEQKLALCELINVLDGEIMNDWTGKAMTKEEAKKYVMDYDKRS